MALTLLEYAKTAKDEIQRGVIETFARSSVVLQLVPWKTILGNAYTYNRENTLPGIAFRGVNESYTEATGLINPLTEKLKIMGGDADTDRFLLKTENSDTDRRSVDIVMKTKAASLYFLKMLIDGDEASDPRQFDGLNKRLTGSQLLTAGATGANLTEAMLQQLVDAVVGEPSALIMSKKMRRQVYNLYKGSSIITEVRDAFGKAVTAYAGIPIAILEDDNSGAEILGFDENVGGTLTCGSIYAIRFGDEFMTGLHNAPLNGYDLGELETKPAYRYRIEWYLTIALFNAKSAARLQGVTAAVS